MHLWGKRLTPAKPTSKMFFRCNGYTILSSPDLFFDNILEPLFMRQILTARRLRDSVLLIMLLCTLNPGAYSQNIEEPLREELLNGLRILIWPRPRNPELTLKLRIHSGAAFDLAGKSGSLGLLGDLLFPDPATIEFFTEEMDGRLDVDIDLDSLTITMKGKASELERMIEILRNALVTTQFNPDVVARQRERRIKIIRETTISPALVADRAIAARLFGDYPYGRPPAGSAEDLGRIERGDLMLARERFLNPNNATLSIVGGVERNRTMRALRQLLGAWRKSEQIVPATFRRAEPPDSRTLIINGPADQTADVRIAVRGLTRSDSDSHIVDLLAHVAAKRWLAETPELLAKPYFVRHEPHALPGMFVMGAAINSKSAASVLINARKVLESLVSTPVSTAELEEARNEVLLQLNNQLARPETMVDAWLDLDTFRVAPIPEQIQKVRNASPADLKRVASRLFQGAPVASIVLGNAEELKSVLEGQIQSEVMGQVPKPISDPSGANPGANPTPAPSEPKPATTPVAPKPNPTTPAAPY